MVTVALLATCCTGGDGSGDAAGPSTPVTNPTGTATPDPRPPPEPLTRRLSEPGPNRRHIERVTGRLVVSQTCWQLEADGHRYTVALPPGFELTGDVLTDTAGQTYSPGDEIDAIATEISVGDVDFPGGADGRWALYHAGCDPDGWPVLLVGDVAHAFDPRALTAPELRELVEDAELSQAVHGGSGFYHHSPDGRVAVSVEPRPGIVENPADGDTVVVATVVFPDDAWTAEVLVGKNFGAGAGNDTPPGWYADWVTAARLDLVDGRLEDLIVQAVPDSCDRMTATLVGAVAVTATGDRVDLPRINLFNGARNCF